MQTVTITNTTKGQRDVFDWMLGALEPAWEDWVEEGEEPEMPPMPYFVGNKIMIPLHEGLLDDIYYRLEIQTNDMAIGCGNPDDEAKAFGFARAGKNMADKIRDAVSALQSKSRKIPA